MKAFFIYIFFFLFLISLTSYSQEVKKHDMKSYKDSTGKLYWNKEMPVYIRLASSPSDTGQLLKSFKSSKYTEPYYFDTEGENTLRTRWETDPVTGKPLSTKTEIIWDVYADSRAPVSAVDFLNSKPFLKSGLRYFGKSLSLDIMGLDKLSGVEKTFFSLNKEPFKEFNEEIKLSQEGAYLLKFYSVDNVGNAETPKEEQFYIDNTPPVADYVITGGTYQNIYSVNTKIMLSAFDSLAGVSQIYYKFDESAEKVYTANQSISIATLDNGDHKFSYYAVDNVQNKAEYKNFTFYLDKMAPILSSTIIGDQFAKDGKIFFSGRSKLKLTAVDDKAGLSEIRYKVNETSTDFMKYDEPFYLPSISGLHTVKYYAVDNMANKSETQRAIDAKYENYVFNEEKIYVDLTSPQVSYNFSGTNFVTRDTLFLSGKTKINISGQDAESGVSKILYKIDGQNTVEYSESFNFSTLKPGIHNLEISCLDNVNNEDAKKITFILDSDPPKLLYFYSVAPYGKKDGYDVYSKYVTIYLAATDITTGTKEIYYTINNGKETKYLGSITGFSETSLNTVKIRAIDKLDNETTDQISFFIK